MSDTMKKVLEILEKGQINAEEAEKLIRAIGESEARANRKQSDIGEIVHKVMRKVSESIPDGVDAHVHVKPPKPPKPPDPPCCDESVEKVVASLAHGNLTIAPSNDDQVHPKTDAKCKIIHIDDTFTVSIPNGDMTVELPENISIEAIVAMGNVNIGDVELEEMAFKLGCGNLTGKIACTEFDVKIGCGDVTASFGSFDEANIVIGSGNTAIVLETEAIVQIDIHKDSVLDIGNGKITDDKVVNDRRKLTVVYGDEDSEMSIKIGSGNLKIEGDE
jgi:hypothetical protein